MKCSWLLCCLHSSRFRENAGKPIFHPSFLPSPELVPLFTSLPPLLPPLPPPPPPFLLPPRSPGAAAGERKKRNRLRDASRLRGEALSVHKSHYWKFLKYCLMHKTLDFFPHLLLFYWKVNTLQRRYIMHQIEVLSTC